MAGPPGRRRDHASVGQRGGGAARLRAGSALPCRATPDAPARDRAAPCAQCARRADRAGPLGGRAAHRSRSQRRTHATAVDRVRDHAADADVGRNRQEHLDEPAPRRRRISAGGAGRHPGRILHRARGVVQRPDRADSPRLPVAAGDRLGAAVGAVVRHRRGRQDRSGLLGRVLSHLGQHPHRRARCPPIFLRSASCLGANRVQTMWLVILPAALPMILTGLRQSIGISLIVLVAAELSGATAGVAYMMSMGHQLFRVDVMF
ncbi:MAG: ABC transporter permease subunit, partial [Alphaproteobacteria bacterium]|nr:ABC transporter permease subunit [Alphaproteobacteria bacterium]